MDVIGIRDVILIRHMGNDPEPALKAPGELVGRAFHWRTVKAVADILRFPPLGRLFVQELHDLNAEIMPGWVGVADALHPVHTFTEPGIAKADRAVVVIEEPVDLLTFGKAADRSVLPEDRGDIARRAEERLMPDAQRPMAQLCPFLHQLPELFLVPLC